AGTIHLYAVDWDAYGGNRYENVTVDDGTGPRVAHLATSFVQGAWIHAPISVGAGGSVVITVDKTVGCSAVLSAVSLSGAIAPARPPLPHTPPRHDALPTYAGTIHLYAVDWDAYGGNRYENITVDDGSGPRIARLATSFVQGAWIHAPISVGAGGSVVITVEK